MDCKACNKRVDAKSACFKFYPNAHQVYVVEKPDGKRAKYKGMIGPYAICDDCDGAGVDVRFVNARHNLKLSEERKGSVILNLLKDRNKA
jgi:hypothetical protein